MRKRFYLLLLCFMAVFCTSVQSWAVVRYVNINVSGGTGDGLSWPNAYNNLQAALTAAQNGDEIWVAKGTYYPDEGGLFANDDRTASFTMKNGVAIYGGFVGIEPTDYDLSLRNFADNETILSGDIDKDNTADAENAYHVIFNDFTSGTPLTSTAVLDGFTIKDGYANGSAPHSSGAGMYNNYASPTVRHCTFSNNSIVGNCYGGGMYNANSSPQVSDCSFSGNNGKSLTSSLRSYGIGMYNVDSSPTITNCTFTSNTAEDKDYSYGGGIYNTNSSPVISSCTFTNHTTTFGPGIFNRNSPLNISNCTFTNNQVYTYPGGVNGSGINTRSSTGTITNCRFINNGGVGSIGIEDGALVEIIRCSFSGNEYGIALSEASPNISNCLFTGNSYGGVVAWYGASTPVIINCTFSENPGSGLGSISNYGDNSPILKNCILWGSGKSVYVFGSKPQPTITHSIVKQASGVYTGTGNLNIDPLFINAADPDGADNILGTADDGLRLQPCSPAINIGNDADNSTTLDLAGNDRKFGTIDLGVYEYQGNPATGTRLYVNQAVTASGDGTTWASAYQDLQVALATARTCSNITEIWVAAGTYKPTTGTDRAISFSMKNGVAIYGGFPNTGNPTFADRNWNSNVTILSGDIGTVGDNSDNSYRVINNDGNGLNNTAILDGVTITGGNSNVNNPYRYGGGMYNSGSSPKITNCIFTLNYAANTGGGMNNVSSSSPVVTNCSFLGNSAVSNGGAIYNYASSPVLTNCRFFNNSAFSGGGIYNIESSTPSITNCSFSGNQGFIGGAMYNFIVNPSLSNCIIWGNSSGIFNAGSNPTVTYSIIEQPSGVYPGTGNLNADPLFVNAAGGDLRLQPCSPAINAGNDGDNSSTTDLAGNNRKFGTIDLGAYEYQGNAVAQPTASASTTTANVCVGNTINLSANGGDTYSWNGPSGSNFNSTDQNPSFSGSSDSYSGLYTVTVSNDNCPLSATATVSVQVNAKPTLNVTPPSSQCGGTINLNTVLSSDGSLSYFTDSGFSSSAVNPVSSSGPYYAKALSTASCSATASVSITINTSATISVTPPSSQCGGTINLSTAFGTNGSLSYFTDSGFSSSASNPVGSSGTYYAKASVGTCTATATVSVNINPVPAASINPATAQICTGQNLSLSTNAGGGGYSWAKSGGTFSSTTNQATFSSNVAGGFSISVTVANSFSCTSSATASVTVVTQPTASISPSTTQSICQGQSLNLIASGGGPYSWSGPGNFNSTNAIASLNTSSTSYSGVYRVTVGSGVCTATATVSVQIQPSITVSVSFAPVCLVGNPLNLSASGGDEYRWRGPNSFTSTSATPTKAKTVAKDEGVYSVTVTGNAVCTATSTIRVYFGIGTGEITITNRSPYCKGGPIILTATAVGASSYRWSKQFGTATFTGNPVTITNNAKSSDGGVYIVFVTGQNGCIEKQETLVTVSQVACIGTRLANEEGEEIDMEINAYPNPVTNTLTVEVTLQKSSKLSLQLFNSIGNESGTWQLNEESTVHKTELNMSELTGGVYLLQAQAGKQKVVKRVVKIQY